MASFSKILLPVDFSERSVGAARYAEALARPFQSELILLHVLAPPQYEFGALEFGGTTMAELYQNRSAHLEQELEAFEANHLQDLRVRRVVLEGDPAARIVAFAHEHKIDLIVMPTHGYGPFRRFILGSITAKVLHDADCPVWTGVHLEQSLPAATLEFRRILCAIDLGPQSCKVLELAVGIGRSFGASLAVVHANTCTRDARGEHGDRDWSRQTAIAAREELERLERRFQTSFELYLESGDPPKVVCAAAERFQADLLVIGRGSARGVFGRLRTNAYAIIRQSPCPVASV